MRADSGEIEAEIIRRVARPEDAANRVVGVFRRDPRRRRHRGGGPPRQDRVPRRRDRMRPGCPMASWSWPRSMPSRRFGKQARILERLGPADAPDAISRLTIAAFEIPAEFPAAALAEAESAVAHPAILADSGRADLRDLPLVTIDGEDARDFDDAVWAEPDPDPDNRGGWHIVVAIADVAAYVAAGERARPRGGAARQLGLFPGPRRADAARGAVERSVLAAAGRGSPLRRGAAVDRFGRAASAGTASSGRHALGGAADLRGGAGGPGRRAATRCRSRPSGSTRYTAPLPLSTARRARGALELDLAEHRVVLDEDRRPIAVVPRARLDSHRLIEEFMILANVAAAEELEARQQACMYRVHDAPDPEKLAALRDFLDEIGIPGLALAKGQVIRPSCSTASWRAPPRRRSARSSTSSSCAARRRPSTARTISAISASPCRATPISPRRSGAMPICSCIGRWSRGGAPAREAGDSLGAIAEHISATERRAAAAERSALDRYRASLLGGAIGTVFEARITGVASFGAVRDPARKRRRRADPDLDAAVRLLRPRFGAPPSRRPPHRPRFRARRRRRRDPGRGGRDRRPDGVPARRSFGFPHRRAGPVRSGPAAAGLSAPALTEQSSHTKVSQLSTLIGAMLRHNVAA